MQPATPRQQQNNIVAVADRLSECKVLHDALVQGRPPRSDFSIADPMGYEAWVTINERFTSQARTTMVVHRGDKPGIVEDETWQTEPTFKMRFADKKFALLAAQRVLDERNVWERAINRLTRRTSAAKRIQKVLMATPDYAPITEPPKTRPWD